MKMIEIKPPSRLKCFPMVLNRDINLFRLLNVAQNPRLVSFEWASQKSRAAPQMSNPSFNWSKNANDGAAQFLAS